jgi:hypothetical protein
MVQRQEVGHEGFHLCHSVAPDVGSDWNCVTQSSGFLLSSPARSRPSSGGAGLQKGFGGRPIGQHPRLPNRRIRSHCRYWQACLLFSPDVCLRSLVRRGLWSGNVLARSRSASNTCLQVRRGPRTSSDIRDAVPNTMCINPATSLPSDMNGSSCGLDALRRMWRVVVPPFVRATVWISQLQPKCRALQQFQALNILVHVEAQPLPGRSVASGELHS